MDRVEVRVVENGFIFKSENKEWVQGRYDQTQFRFTLNNRFGLSFEVTVNENPNK